MAALDEEEGKLLATSSSSWYGIIKVLFFFFSSPATHSFALSRDILEVFGGKFNTRDLLSSLEHLSEIRTAPSVPPKPLTPYRSPPCPSSGLASGPIVTCHSCRALRILKTNSLRRGPSAHRVSPALQRAASALSSSALGAKTPPQPALTSAREAHGSSPHQCPCPPPLPSLAWHRTFTTMELPAKNPHRAPGSHHRYCRTQENRAEAKAPTHPGRMRPAEAAESRSVARLTGQPLNNKPA